MAVNRNDLLASVSEALGGGVASNRNQLLAEIVVAAGGTVTNASNRNALLQDLLDALQGPPVALTMPAGAEWFADNYEIYSDNTTNFDPDIYKKDTGVERFVAPPPLGDNSNDGLTELTPFATPARARQENCDIIVFAPGRYPKAFWDTASAAVAGITHICRTGRAEFLASNLDDSGSFVADSRAGVYRWGLFSDTCYSVWDESVDNGFGGWGWLFPQATADDVETNGGWCVEGGALYVKLDDSRAPDADVRVNTQRRCYPGKSNGVEFYENIDFHGAHVQANPLGSNMVLCFKTCNFGYGSARDAANLDIVSNTEAYLWHCNGYSAYLDCLGYRDTAQVVEIGCNAYDTRLAGSNNASTAHDGSSVIRIADGEGLYHDTVGDTVVDINSGISFNIGIRSWSAAFGTGRSDFNYTNVSGVGMYLINCSNEGHTGQYAIEGNGPKFWQNTEQNITGPVINAVPSNVALY